MSQPTMDHIVVITGCGWSHVRPILHFSMRLATKFPGLFISVYTHAAFTSPLHQYFARYPSPALKRMQVATSEADSSRKGALDILSDMEQGFGPWIANRLAHPSFEIDGLRVETPSYIIEDHLNGGISVVNRQYHELPTVGWYVATATGFLGHFGNSEHGQGWRHFEAVRTAVAEENLTGHAIFDAFAREVIRDRVVYAPGVPPHYEHEQIPQPQEVALPMIVQMHKKWIDMLDHVSAMIYNSLYEMEPIAAEASASGLLRPLPSFCAGLSADIPLSLYHGPNTQTTDPVISFMNYAYTELGPHSVIYMSFGSYCLPAPSSATHLRIIINEIISEGFRLVFAIQAKSVGVIGLGGDYITHMVNRGKAIFSEWTNQLEVLEHPAMHYFVTHGGWNSTTEAIVRGVPMIFWPIAGDQPSNAMQMTRQLDCGFELLQVRTGTACSVAYSRTGDIPILGSDEAVREEIRNILKATRGPRGQQQRLTVRALGKIASRSLEIGGSADAALGKLGHFMGLRESNPVL